MHCQKMTTTQVICKNHWTCSYVEGFNQVRTSPLEEASLSRGSIQGMVKFTNDFVKKDGIYLMW